nr:hypothetical protein [Tanacetum cinerariifolium]
MTAANGVAVGTSGGNGTSRR